MSKINTNPEAVAALLAKALPDSQWLPVNLRAAREMLTALVAECDALRAENEHLRVNAGASEDQFALGWAAAIEAASKQRARNHRNIKVYANGYPGTQYIYESGFRDGAAAVRAAIRKNLHRATPKGGAA